MNGIPGALTEERYETLLIKSRSDVVYRRIRLDMIAALLAYATHGHLPGGFLTAVLSNDLREAISRADHENLAVLKEIVTFVYMELPSPCWGSAKAVFDWTTQFEQAPS